MRYLKRYVSLLVLLLFVKEVPSQHIIIPRPQEMEIHEGIFGFGSKIKIQQEGVNPEIEYLETQLESILNIDVATVKRNGNVRIVIDTNLSDKNPESYELTVNQKGSVIIAPSNVGAFYGIQTLLQIFEEHKDNLELPYVSIRDEPELTYRGMMLDVGRHFFGVEEVKHFLDYLAAYKYNKFHWHLTEDQGWRIEIKKYPLLTKVGAWRDETQIGRYFDYGQYDHTRYGGFYTQEEIREVVAYAQKLHIDVIPEIEMPGHAQAAIASYPELGCTDEPVSVGTRWGVSQDIYCPNEITFKFLENVIDEVVELFPYEYIHIGGDEAAKEQWRESSFVQGLIKKLGLKDEEEMQSYFITRMEKYINSKGKRMIGWDEILQGGLAPDATVMSWRGESGGIAAARSGHQAIMTPASTNYFDYYQGNPATEPLTWGGDLRLEKVYAYQPIPSAMTPEEKRFIWGTQGNLWTEYITDFNHVQYMIFPRMMALAEVAWGTAQPDHYKEFEHRVIRHFDILDRKGIAYSRAIFEIEGKPTIIRHQLFDMLASADKSESIRYTTDNAEPVFNSNLYTDPILIDKNMTIKAAGFSGKKRISAVTEQHFNISKSTGKEIEVVPLPSPDYEEGDPNTLVDGVRGDISNHRVRWLGFKNEDVTATIDFGRTTEIHKISFRVLNLPDWDIRFPVEVQIFVSSDGRGFEEIREISKEEIMNANGQLEIEFPKSDVRYLKIRLLNVRDKSNETSRMPDSYIFIDEIGAF